jgi:dUTPase
MSEAINMHKRIAMGEPNAETHLKKGGKVRKYASGGAVAESKAANLPARGDRRNAGVDFNAGKAKVATMKRGGSAKKPGLMIAIAVGRKGAARSR